MNGNYRPLIRVSLLWSINILNIIFKEVEGKEEQAQKVRREGSKAGEDFKDEAEVEAEDISKRAHLQVNTSEKRSSL